MLVRHCLMLMLVIFAVFTVNVNMGVSVCMLVGMNNITVAVFVGMDMCMLVGVLKFNGIFNHKISAHNHNNQGDVELDCRPFTQKQHTECHAEKRSD